jgi:two-component system, cell cycle response regulator DivK
MRRSCGASARYGEVIRGREVAVDIRRIYCKRGRFRSDLNEMEQQSLATAQRPVILVVDDDLDARLIYRHYLTVMGCQVYTASDGLIGVQLAKRKKPDVIVMDLAMPRLNGWAATAELKQMSATRDIPIIVLTALPASRQDVRDAGCSGLLAKPCLPELLWSEIRSLLNPPTTAETN